MRREDDTGGYGSVLEKIGSAVQIVFMPNQNDSKAQLREQMLARNDPGAKVPVQKAEVARKPYQFLMIPTLREYLALEFQTEEPLPFPYDPERIIDDFGAPHCTALSPALGVCTPDQPWSLVG